LVSGEHALAYDDDDLQTFSLLFHQARLKRSSQFQSVCVFYVIAIYALFIWISDVEQLY